MITKTQLSPGVELHCFRDDRFKQSRLSVQFIRPMCRQEAALNALLPAVLLRGTEQYPDLQTITVGLDELYGAAVGTLVRRVGDYQTTGLYSAFLDDRFSLDKEPVLAPMLQMISQLLFHPVLENGLFREDFLESEKKNLIAAIEAQRNDKRLYAATRLTQYMCAEDSFGVPRLGEVSQVREITPQLLYDHYQKILRQSPVLVYYVGSAPAQEVADLLRPLFAHLQRQVCPLKPQTDFQDAAGGDYEEALDVAQGKLCMGFVTPITLRTPQFAAMQVLNTLFGGGMTSKLFMQIREKQSLCYDIGSAYHGSKGIMTVSAGIDFQKVDTVKKQVLSQLEACREGNFTQAELLAAKQALCSNLRATHDSTGAIENYYATTALSGLGMNPEQYMQAVEQVRAQQVAEAAKTVKLHTTYFLKGVQV